MAQESAIRVVLKNGDSEKVVMLRELKIKHQTLAAQAVGNKAGDNNVLMGMMMQQELLKLLIISVNDVRPSKADIENLDSFFSIREYNTLSKVVGKLMGGDEGECLTEIVTTGKP